MKHAMLVLFAVGLIAPAGGRSVPTTQVYSVLQVVTHPQRWIGRTILVRGVALRAPFAGLMLVDTRLVASLPQKGLTPDDAAVMAERAYIESMTPSPVPILFLRSQHVSQYDHNLKPRIYRVLLHPIPCTKTTVCKQGDLLGPYDAAGESHRAGSVTCHDSSLLCVKARCVTAADRVLWDRMQQHDGVRWVQEMAARFIRMVRERQCAALEPWLEECAAALHRAGQADPECLR